MINCKGHGRKRSWLNVRFYPGIGLEGLRKTKKKLQDRRCPDRNLYPGLLEYETGV
jgi:hypothetical protein